MDVKYLCGVFLILISGLQLSCQISLPSDATYYAGVVEFPPDMTATSKQRARNNMNGFKSVIESDDTRDLDILIFPEFVLNNRDTRSYVPRPEDDIAPCDIPDYEWFLRELSCAARSRRLYVVINVLEKEVCRTVCDPSGLNTYNTNVVFDRQGRIISRYRKTHLYRGEWYTINVMTAPEMATFTTDFGVTFGHFIGFDMLFDDPAQRLIRQLNVTDVIYTTHWFSELPFLTAVQLQEGWAFANDVNLMAADAAYPAGQQTGSGIYAGKFGRLSAIMQEQATRRLLKARVPKRSHRDTYQMPPVVQPTFTPHLELPRFTQLSLLRDYNVDIFSTHLLPVDFTSVSAQRVCHGDEFCCEFTIKRQLVQQSTTHVAYRYRLAAYSGDQVTLQRSDSADLSVCSLIACTNEELYSCGHIFPDGALVGHPYFFQAINITAEIRNTARRLIMPTSVDGVLMPLPVDTWEMHQMAESSKNVTLVSMSLIFPKSDLLTFGIWANHYSAKTNTHNLDPSIDGRNSSAGAMMPAWSIAMACVYIVNKM